MARTKLTNQDLLDRVSPISITDYNQVSNLMTTIRKFIMNYKTDYSLIVNIANKMSDPLFICMEYGFRYKDKEFIDSLNITDNDIKRYIISGYNYGMSIKNQLRLRIEYYYPDLLKNTKSKTITGAIRAFCNQ